MNSIPPDEMAWARDCLAAGDTLRDLAAASGRPVSDWRGAFPDAKPVVDVPGKVALRLANLVPARPTFVDWSSAFEIVFALAAPEWRRPDRVKIHRTSRGSVWQARFQSTDGAVYRMKSRLQHGRDGHVEVYEQVLAVSSFVRSEARGHR